MTQVFNNDMKYLMTFNAPSLLHKGIYVINKQVQQMKIYT